LGARTVDGIQMTSEGTKPKAWKDVWSAGHGVGAIHDIPSVDTLVARLRAEYLAACDRATWQSSSGQFPGPS
jgi:hypothetical protein